MVNRSVIDCSSGLDDLLQSFQTRRRWTAECVPVRPEDVLQMKVIKLITFGN